MPYKINDKQIESVKKLDNQKRYEHLLKIVADWEEIWTIKLNEGFLLFGDENGNEYIPIWPHPEYIKDFQKEDWEKATPESISLDDWLNIWTPGMISENKRIAIFPVIDKMFGTITAEEFKNNLLFELQNYE